MESRRMTLTLFSASDLNSRIILSDTKVYAIARISNDRKNRQKTRLGKGNGTAPTWNNVMKFLLDDAALQQGRLFLEIIIYADANVGNKEIGRVSVPLNEFLRPAGGKKGATTSAKFVSYPVRKPSGKDKGVLNLSVKLAAKPELKQQQLAAKPELKQQQLAAKPKLKQQQLAAKPKLKQQQQQPQPAKAEPVAAYPYQGYHPPPYQGYTPPPYQGYIPNQGYPPPPYQGYIPNQGYLPYQWYPPVAPAAQQPPKKHNILGMDLMAGFGARVLEDLLLQKIVGPYDGGFGGFDFGGGGGGGFDFGGGGFDGGF